MTKCPNCGQETIKANFCHWCGYPLKTKLPSKQSGRDSKRFPLLLVVLLIVGICIIGGGIVAAYATLGGGSAYVPQATPSPRTTPIPTSQVPPIAPSNLAADTVSQRQVVLRWFDNSNNEEGFRIYRENSLVATVGTNITTYQDTGLEPATTYHYSVKSYNQAGESGASLCTVRMPNPPITIRLDRIGVFDNREDWTRGKDGEIYVGMIVTDGNTIVEKRFPQQEGQHYKLEKNETVDIGTIIFSVDEVGDYIRIAAIGYEDDGGQGEMLLYQALGAAGEAYISGGASTLLEMTDFSLGNLLAKLFGAEDDWLGSYEQAWSHDSNWGIGRYSDIACEDERGVLCLRLWFTIESP